ncbi:class I SAM-dependent methyltransferase [Sphingomonas sp. 37zxx]|uniref:class I SAM-dependent methyltransferase n=1 Tax=Sphingomonas sp. 37zxx TaxID=1550073 RepID=UPI00053BFBDA|nr:class I SAM-dependent methyltransferase [Sphingomonas sp. 37zxx]
MTDLLIHSMREFSDLILGSLGCAEARHVVEIGAEFGGMSQMLADYVEAVDGHLTSIDPAPKHEFLAWAKRASQVTHVAAPSLEVIDTLQNVDAWVIDGDHNYYTVFHELQAAARVGKRDGKPLLAFLHDVSWPTARRDMYYAPERIPPEYRHPHTFGAGAMLGRIDLVPGQGFRGEQAWAMANRSGGPRNGVLTAVEDFIAESTASGRPLAFAHVPAVFGLGILFDVEESWSAAIAELVAPYHDNPLLASLEQNRLRNYMKVIEWQDRTAA